MEFFSSVCHSELVSESQEMLKQVQHDNLIENEIQNVFLV
jgi:hypothetical protein